MNRIAIAAALVAFTAPGFAQTTSTPRIDKRQERQEQRIEKGATSGQLTAKEQARLEKGQAHVQKVEDKVAADGTVTRNEKARVEKAQDRQSRRIARERHDKQHN